MLDIGYHVIEEDAIDDHGGVFDEQMSIVEFLRRVDRMNEIPMDVTVYGLDAYLRGAHDSERVAEYIHSLLRDRVNFLLNQQPVVQFVVDEVQTWDGPVIPDDDERIELNPIFHGSLSQQGVGWYSSNLNVQS
jgi:hypothetical protein